jgi:chromosome partitioning protein
MAKVITVASQKGGVGKTTTALNLGYSLSRFGDRVIVVDGDPQGGIGISTNLRKVTSTGLIQFMRGDCGPADIVMQSKDKAFSVVGIGINGPEDVFALETWGREKKLTQAIATLGENADYVIIDAPAGIGELVHSLFLASDSVLLVINCQIITLKTLPNFFKLMSYTQKENSSLRLEGILFTMMNKGKAEEAKLFNDFRQTYPEEVFFKTIIPNDALFTRASFKAIPIGLLSGGQRAARYYLDLAMELKERETQFGTGGGEDENEGLF